MKVRHDTELNNAITYSKIVQHSLERLDPRDGHDPASELVLIDALLGNKPDIAFIPFAETRTTKLEGTLYNNTKPLDQVVAVGPVLAPIENQRGVLSESHDIKQYFDNLENQNPKPKRVIVPLALQPKNGGVNHMAVLVKEGDKVMVFDSLGRNSGYAEEFIPFLEETGIDRNNIQWGQHKTLETNGLHCGDWVAWFTENIASDLEVPMTEAGINNSINTKLGNNARIGYYDEIMSEQIFAKHKDKLTLLNQSTNGLIDQQAKQRSQTQALGRIEAAIDADAPTSAKIKLIKQNLLKLQDIDLTKHRYTDGKTILQKLNDQPDRELLDAVSSLLDEHARQLGPAAAASISASNVIATSPSNKQIIEPIEATDKFIFANEVGAASKRGFSNNITSSDVVDPITQAIRDKVLTSQQLYLQQELAKQLQGAEKTSVLNANLPKFRTFLVSKKGAELLTQVTANPRVQQELHTIESSGYKAVHNQFSDRFHEVAWQAPSAGKVRSTDVKNQAGTSVCKLSETTFDTEPTAVSLSDGTERVIRSYRQINFPKTLEAGNGPVHLSMALKDENGRNIAKKDAVYFTAHYDENGKLEEVSTPVPVKFSGASADAIGYIERDGKVFTLPVTQGKYQEMMKEVAKNKGMGTDISQSISQENLAPDLVITPKKSIPPDLLQSVVKIRQDIAGKKAPSTKTAPRTKPPTSNGRGV